MCCLISPLANVIHPMLAVRRHVSFIGEIIYILNEGQSRRRLLVHRNVHEHFPAKQDCGSKAISRSTAPRLFIKVIEAVGHRFDLFAKSWTRISVPVRAESIRSFAVRAKV